MNTTAPTRSQQPQPASELRPIWQRRFDFYSRAGSPGSEQARAALKELSLGQRMRITFNIVGFLVGPLYLVIKGMWRKGLVLLGAAFAVGAVSVIFDFSDDVVHAASIAFSTLTAQTANYAYFLHKTRGSTSWNPFEGFFRR